ncbi:cell division protein FtsX [Mariniphaga sediminis]|uniref:Cell division protein FtsX n=1 Tax=Mariniphaga sediminis TaxID=1628158 RepID=A0A399D7W5_9BACT|nr:permease-like cell division protein FtsX [Mariniphaga sediminis]RIH66410.1 cell division protein FtsX [Mariniphaga sediminis]
MKTPKPRKLKKRVFRSWITSTVSISLVLVMLGALLLILVNAGRLSDYVREQIGFTLVLHEDVREVDVIRLEKVLAATDYVKSTRYIDKETAARELTDELGEDFSGFLGYNPLFASFDVKLFAPYTSADSLLLIEKEFLEFPQVKEVYYQKDLLAVINENVSKISIFLLIASGLTGFIFMSLINNTIRISIYSERFTINTMQLVGAARSFVRKPFLRRGLLLGIYGALAANTLLISTVFVFRNELGGIVDVADLKILGPVFLLVILLGVAISYISTWFAVNKFLKMKFDELFY